MPKINDWRVIGKSFKEHINIEDPQVNTSDDEPFFIDQKKHKLSKLPLAYSNKVKNSTTSILRKKNLFTTKKDSVNKNESDLEYDLASKKKKKKEKKKKHDKLKSFFDRFRSPVIKDKHLFESIASLNITKDLSIVKHDSLVNKKTSKLKNVLWKRYWESLENQKIYLDYVKSSEKDLFYNTSNESIICDFNIGDLTLNDIQKKCLDEPNKALNWLILSRVESTSQHFSLSKRDRLNRRLSILYNGLSHISWDLNLLSELLHVIESRDTSEDVNQMYYNILVAMNDSKVRFDEFKTYIVYLQNYGLQVPDHQSYCRNKNMNELYNLIDVSIHEILPPPGFPKLYPELLLSYSYFLRSYVSIFNFTSYLETIHLFENKMHRAPPLSRHKSESRFDQLPTDVLVSYKYDSWKSDVWINLACSVIQCLKEGGQYNLIWSIFQALCHLEYITFSKMNINLSDHVVDEILDETQVFWTSQAPRIGERMSSELYYSLVNFNSSKFIINNIPLEDKVKIANQLLDEHKSEKYLEFPTKDSCMGWINREEYFNDLSLVNSQEFKQVQASNNHHQYLCNPLTDDFNPNIRLVLHLLMSKYEFEKPIQIATHQSIIFQYLLFLNFPFISSYHSSSITDTKTYLDDTLVYEDLLLALLQGLRKRFKKCFYPNTLFADDISSTNEDVTMSHQKQLDDTTENKTVTFPLSFAYIFGYNVPSNMTSSFSFYYRTLIKIKHFLTCITKEYIDNIANTSWTLNLKKVNEELDHIEQSVAHRTSLNNLWFKSINISLFQLLIWCEANKKLVSTVIASLVYQNDKKLARVILKHYQQEPDYWITYGVWNFISCPDSKNYFVTREMLARYYLQVLSICNLDSYVLGWIRFECLSLIRFKHLHNEYLPNEYDYSSICPHLLHILNLHINHDKDTWNQYFNSTTTNVESNEVSNMLKFWDPDTSPTFLQLVTKTRHLENQLKSTILPSELEPSSCSFTVSSYFSKTLFLFMGLAIIDSPKQAWITIVSLLEPNNFKDIKNHTEVIQHDRETVLDLVLLIIMSSTPHEHKYSISWTHSLVEEIALTTLRWFPQHHRAYLLLKLLPFKGFNIIKSLPSLNYNLYLFFLLELEDGAPSFKYIKEKFELVLSKFPYSKSSYIWCLYTAFLQMSKILKNFFFTCLPCSDSSTKLNETLRVHLSSVCERARFCCSYSKRLWTQILFILSVSNEKSINETSDTKTTSTYENRFLHEVALVESVGIPFHQDPLKLLLS